ncbi:hypothetical protein [Cupriavidus necator]|uniref:hypothetical protein n=1 Tax=Cupriavidus necator TaxID=106590 RepID=UPI0030F3C363
MKTFQFDLESGVKLSQSGERGVVIGRAEYVNSAPQYQVRYVAADGRQVEGWWDGQALVADQD